MIEYKEFAKFLIDVSHETSISLTEKNIQSLYKLYKIYIKEREKFNFSAIRDYKEIIIKHFIDSLFLEKYITNNSSQILDLGPGGGFPSIPLAIKYKKHNFTLIERKTKFAKLLNLIIEELELSNVKIYNNQLQELKNKQELKNNFDLITARAVGSFKKVCKLIKPFAKKGGIYLAQKSKNYKTDLQQIKKLNYCQILNIDEFILPKTQIKRVIILIKIT